MKKSVGFVSCLLIAIMAPTSIIACGPKNPNGVEIDDSKTQLYVYTYKGGYGDAWLQPVIERFEKDFADYKLNDKVGVQIVPNAQKKIINPGDNLRGRNDEVFFTESTNYTALYQTGDMLDITDMVKEDMSNKYTGESGSVLDKFYQEQKDYYNIKDAQGGEHYYAVPHYFTPFGITYNKELFAEGNYISNTLQNGQSYSASVIESEYESGKTTVTNNNIQFCKPNATKSNLSAGPDGQPGTFDDGLPATYAEFYLLCEQLKTASAYAVHWGGAPYKDYFRMFLAAVATNNEGAEQMRYNFDYSTTHTATDLIKMENSAPVFENGNPVLETVEITSANGYELARQQGKYYAVDFVMTILNNKNWYRQDQGLLFSGGHTHLKAQEDFIRAGKTSNKNIGMLIDGSWWESEATDVFAKMARENDPNFAKDKRDFAYMPLPFPKASQVGTQKQALYDLYNAFGFIKSSIAPEKAPLAKAFLQYCNTDVSLQEYSKVTNTLKALKYEITDDYYNGMTNYGKSLYDLKNTSDIVFPLSGDNYFIQNRTKFTYDAMFNGTKTDGGKLDSPVNLYPSSNQTVTSKDYSWFMYRYLKGNWGKV